MKLVSCRYRGRTGRPEDAAENVSNLEVFGLDAHVGDDVGGDANGGKGGCRAQERAGSVVKLRRCSLTSPPPPPPPPPRPTDIDSRGHCSLTSLFQGRFHRCAFFRWFLACRWSTGHKAGIRVWKFFKSSNLQELALLLLASQQSAKVDKQH